MENNKLVQIAREAGTFFQKKDLTQVTEKEGHGSGPKRTVPIGPRKTELFLPYLRLIC